MKKQLKDFEVSSNGNSKIFWDKLTKENDWSLSFAKEAYAEYKRFLWLAKITKCKASVPSKVVDKVWHLHMTFTKSYWHDLCRDVLGFELHHIPTSDTKEEKQAGLAGYENTLVEYKNKYGVLPSKKYWPIPNINSDAGCVGCAGCGTECGAGGAINKPSSLAIS